MSFADAEAYQLYILAETDYSEGALLPKFLPKNGGMIVQVCGNARVTRNPSPILVMDELPTKAGAERFGRAHS
jgi:hypothetical protein